MKTLKISKDVSLPLEVVTQTIAILAKRRAGKSYTMRRIAEQLLDADQQIVIVDPKGDQWGIRSSADGKKAGYPIVILGGEHADVPLEVGAGEIVAKLVVEERVSILLDLSMFRKHEISTFMAIFLENLYRLKAREEYRTPVMLVVDEADAIAPQKPQKGEERMLGAIEDIVRRGGQRGIGCILVTQRSAVLNKNVLTQAQMLIVLRTIAPQDLAAMKAWIDVHGTLEQGKELIDSLPSLPIGDAWFWSPGWPTETGIFERSHVLPITTFDSGATPKPGEKKVVPKNLADVNLEALKKQMAATIEKAKADDPRELRKRIAELTKEVGLGKKNPMKMTVPDQSAIDRVVKAAVHEKERQHDAERSEMIRQTRNFLKIIAEIGKIVAPFLDEKKQGESIKTTRVRYAPIEVRTAPKDDFLAAAKETQNPKITEEVVPDGELTNAEIRVLAGIAWMENIGIEQPQKEIVAFLSGYAHLRSKGFMNPASSLRSRGLIDYPSPGKISLTNEGRATAQFPEAVGTTADLHQRVLERLNDSQRRVLKPLLESYPDPMVNTDLAAAAGYAHERSKGYMNPRSALRSFGLIDYPSPGLVVALPVLFIDR